MRLVRNLMHGQIGVLSIGGLTTDHAWRPRPPTYGMTAFTSDFAHIASGLPPLFPWRDPRPATATGSSN